MTQPVAHDRRVLVIDDDEVILMSCREVLQRIGYEVDTRDNGEAGLDRLLEWRPPLLVVDLKMPGLDGFQVIERARELHPGVVVVVITGYATVETAVDAMKAGAYDFLPKPFTPMELRLIVDRGCERWRLARETERLRREKEEAERKFITLVSHQLKAPLGAVKQYLDVMLHTSQEQLSPHNIEWISRCQTRVGEMLDIIGDWLILARIDHRALCECHASVDLAAVVDNVVRSHQPTASASNIQIATQLVPGPVHVRGDETSITMLLSNLVGNAVKYNRPTGTVEIRIRCDGCVAIVEVSDTGIGIPEDGLSCLFEEFYRVKCQETQNIAGTGLGLAICKRIVCELGGSISVRSKVAQGSTFTVRVPLAQHAQQDATPTEGQSSIASDGSGARR